MMTNKTHQVADFDSIVGDENSRQILALANLQPSSWNLPDLEVERILGSGLWIHIQQDLGGINWPACVNRDEKLVNVARDFLELENFTQEEKLATILHEIGHIVNREPKQERFEDMTESERMTLYFGTLRHSDAPAGISELYADDYARHCGHSDHLGTSLRLLYETRENFLIQSTRDRIARLDANERPLLLNLTPVTN